MPPILNMLSLSSVIVAEGSYVTDGTSPRVITTGLQNPIVFVWCCWGDVVSRSAWKLSSFPGRLATGAAPSLTGVELQNGIGLVNDGLDFDVRADDYWSLNEAGPATTVYWFAMA